ncbi:hypothetical protein [Anaeromyxobacter sp. SG66]|uniref:hypothetical protein n=1 Tax=Anaeromyxobacter sp. SG66 TaxID=2925410 RepID=UPI001F5A189A|nr:hypothetical protein [Anaeromyxobacter sp. SG66]
MPRPTPAVSLETKEIPQADMLDTVFRVLELTAAGAEITPQALGVVERQVLYYVHAAKVLGFLDKDGEPTPAGWRCLPVNAAARLRCAADGFERSTCGTAWARWAGKRSVADVDPASAAEFLESVSPLSSSTAERRAQTLKAWHEQLWPRAAHGPRRRREGGNGWGRHASSRFSNSGR